MEEQIRLLSDQEKGLLLAATIATVVTINSARLILHKTPSDIVDTLRVKNSSPSLPY
jgi:hypothetical protein